MDSKNIKSFEDLTDWIGDVSLLMDTDDDDVEALKHTSMYEKYRKHEISEEEHYEYISHYTDKHKTVTCLTLSEYVRIVMMLNIDDVDKLDFIRHEHEHALVASKHSIPHTYNLKFIKTRNMLTTEPSITIHYPDSMDWDTLSRIKLEILKAPSHPSKSDINQTQHIEYSLSAEEI